MEKRLYRSRTDRMLWGVCGGLASYFGIDPTIIRLIMVLLIFAGGFGIVAYIIMAIIVPVEGSRATVPGDTVRENLEDMRQTASKVSGGLRDTFGRPREEELQAEERRRVALGVAVIVIGIIFLVGVFNLFWWSSWFRAWPIVVIIIGIVLILTARRR